MSKRKEEEEEEERLKVVCFGRKGGISENHSIPISHYFILFQFHSTSHCLKRKKRKERKIHVVSHHFWPFFLLLFLEQNKDISLK